MNHGPSRRTPERAHARRSFSAAAASYDRAATLQGRVREQLLRRLDEMALRPGRVVDLGCGTGAGAEALCRRYSNAEVLALDFAEPMAQAARARGQRAVAADAACLPLPPGCVDVMFSSLALQWCASLAPVLREARRVLRPGGVLLFSTLGPGTLHELRAAWARVDGAPHVHDFLAVPDIESALRTSGLTQASVESAPLIMVYADLAGLTGHLRRIGAVNAASHRQRGLTGKGKLGRLREAYEDFRRADGQLPATFEVVHCRAERAAPTGVERPCRIRCL